MTEPPEIVVARLLSREDHRKFFILSDGKERFFCGGRHFPNGIPDNQLISFIPKPPTKGRGTLREVGEVLFQQEEEKVQ